MAETLFAARGGNAGSNLYTLDPATGAETVVGATGIAITGLAFDPTDGTLYASTSANSPSSARRLYTINPTTGAATLVGNLKDISNANLLGPCADIAFDGDGQLWGWSEANNPEFLVAIDKTTAIVDPNVGDFPYGTYGDGFDFHRTSGLVYVMPSGEYDSGSDPDGRLYIFDKSDQTTILSTVVLSNPVYGSGFASVAAASFRSSDNTLWAIINNFGAGSTLVRIDYSTGAITSVGTLAFANFDALAWSEPVFDIIQTVFYCEPKDHANTGSATVTVLGDGVRDTQTLDPFAQDIAMVSDADWTFKIEGDCIPPDGRYKLELQFRWSGTAGSLSTTTEAAYCLLRRNGLPLGPVAKIPNDETGISTAVVGTAYWFDVTDTDLASATATTANAHSNYNGPACLPILAGDVIEVCIFKFDSSYGSRSPEILQTKMTLLEAGGYAGAPVTTFERGQPLGAASFASVDDLTGTGYLTGDVAMCVTDNDDVYVAWVEPTVTTSGTPNSKAKIVVARWNGTSWSTIADDDDVRTRFGESSGVSLATDGTDVWLAFFDAPGYHRNLGAAETAYQLALGPDYDTPSWAAAGSTNLYSADGDVTRTSSFITGPGSIVRASANPTSGCVRMGADINVRPDDGESIDCLFWVTNEETTSPSCYFFRVTRDDGGDDQVSLWKIISGTETQIVTFDAPGASQVNARFFGYIWGQHFELWYDTDINTGGVVYLGSVDDSSITNPQDLSYDADYNNDGAGYPDYVSGIKFGFRLESGEIKAGVVARMTFHRDGTNNYYSAFEPDVFLRVRKLTVGPDTWSDVGSPFRPYESGYAAVSPWDVGMQIKIAPDGVPWVTFTCDNVTDQYTSLPDQEPFAYRFTGGAWEDTGLPKPVNPRTGGTICDISYLSPNSERPVIDLGFCDKDGPSDEPSAGYNVMYVGGTGTIEAEFYFMSFDGADWGTPIKFLPEDYYPDLGTDFSRTAGVGHLRLAGLIHYRDGALHWTCAIAYDANGYADGVWDFRLKADGTDFEATDQTYPYDAWARGMVFYDFGQPFLLSDGTLGVLVNSPQFWDVGVLVLAVDDGTGRGAMSAAMTKNSVHWDFPSQITRLAVGSDDSIYALVSTNNTNTNETLLVFKFTRTGDTYTPWSAFPVSTYTYTVASLCKTLTCEQMHTVAYPA